MESEGFDPKELGDQVNLSQLPAVILNFSRLLGSVGAQFELEIPKILDFIGKDLSCPPSSRENAALLPFWSSKAFLWDIPREYT